MVLWPASLPQDFRSEGFSLEPMSNIASFDPELPPSMTRRRGTSAPERVSGTIQLTDDQWSTFEDFRKNSIDHGAGIFYWRHPISGAPAVMKFDGEPRSEQASYGIWRVSLSLLILP